MEGTKSTTSTLPSEKPTSFLEEMQRLEENGVQTRPVWTLNHIQKPYEHCYNYKIERSEELVNNSLCLPSSTNLSDEDIKNVISNLNG